MRKFKTALFGTGFVGRVHLEGIRRLGYVQLYAIGEPQIEKANQLAAEFGAERTEADYRRILEDPAVDAVHICTPNALHFPIAKDALQAGKHVICEKPLATSVAQAQELVKLAAETKRRNCTFHNLRFYAMVQHMRRMVEDGDLGDIMVVRALILRTGCSTIPIGTGAWTANSTALRAASPTSARTGATWRSM